ncbi:hypothetical protein L6164_028023 [Bauhinia variegata]|uniref:Uncharacterized protein n=1 Tax=Bauhinia variegata TaxID=167791 RepID=A0ACB9LWB7_BAUVA|nr:hypothetical protein L6164_028023 [Bauhinia variegata]
MLCKMPVASRTRSRAKNNEMGVKKQSRKNDGNLEIKKQSNKKNAVGPVSDTQPDSVFARGKPLRANLEKEVYSEDEDVKLCQVGDSDDDDLYIVVPQEKYEDVIDLASSSEVEDDDIDEDVPERSEVSAAVDDEDESFPDHGYNEEEILADSGSPEDMISGDSSGENIEFVEESETKKTGQKTKTIEPGLKRRTAYGLDILIQERDSREDATASVHAGKSVAQRTRSHSKRKTKKLKLGTLSQPICIDQEDEDEEEPEFGSDYGDLEDASNYIIRKRRKKTTFRKTLSFDEEDEEESDSDSEHCDLNDKTNRVLTKKNATRSKSASYDGIDDENHEEFHNGDGASGGSDEAKSSGDEMDGNTCAQNVDRRWKRRKSSAKKHIPSKKDYDVIKILHDSICNKGDVPLENLVSSTNHDSNPADITLPLKFKYGTEETPPEISEEQKELERLWAEYDRILDITVQNSDPVAAEVENDMDAANTATLCQCQQGKHRLIIDDEIGITCAICFHVDTEIKHIVAPFSKYPFGKSGKRDSCADHVDQTMFNDLERQFTGWDNLSSHDHNCSGTVWDIIPGVKNRMYPHQCDAFEFLWKKIASEIVLDKLKQQVDFPDGGGCIISHAPGTGKTLLTIVFLWSFMKLYPNCRPIIIAPKSMLLTWEEEFSKWKEEFGKWKIDIPRIPFHNLNNDEYSGMESKVAMSLLKKSGFSTITNKETIRLVKLFSWKKERSILGIGYSLFKTLAGRSKDLREALLELPGLLVLDEGHTPRNDRSHIWKAVSEIRTRKRIILSGTPFQNTFDELYNTLCLASPIFGGGKKNETKGKWTYLINAIGKASDKNGEKNKLLSEVKGMIRPFVHVYKGSILQETLPGLKVLDIVLKPTNLQKKLLEDIQEDKKKLKNEHLESLIAVHPSLFPSEESGKLERSRINTEDGVKTKFLMELIRLSALVNEKVLVFSQYIAPLTFLTDQLKSRFNWREGKEVLVIRGKDDVKQRQASISTFNDPAGKARVLLASKKACFEGISLIGASRVVLLDVEWNPAVERQAVSRAYRVGQKKEVYTYRLISAGTREEEKCSRQAEKDHLSEFMFSSSDGAGCCQKNTSPALFKDEILEQMLHHENFRHMFDRVATNKRSIFEDVFCLLDK